MYGHRRKLNRCDPFIACGIFFCYNEEHILNESLRHYLAQGIDLVVIDNNSTDESMNIVELHKRQPGKYRGKIIDVRQITTNGYEWGKILRFACDYMHKNLNNYGWVLLIDADSFYYSPVKDMPLLDFMAYTKAYGYNIINGKLLEFYPTEQDNPSIISHFERMQYYALEPQKDCYGFKLPQHKIFLYNKSINFYEEYSHICHKKNPRVSIINFLYMHYPWVSFEHGRKKIFEERKTRYIERKINPWLHSHYIGKLPVKKDLVKPSKELKRYGNDDIFISYKRLSLCMQFRTFVKLYGLISKLFIIMRKPLMESWAIFKHDKSLLFKRLFSYAKEIIKKPAKVKKNAFLKPLYETVEQKTHSMHYPANYHFLMTNACNAQCIFCNQIVDSAGKKEITLEKFKAMALHIPDIESPSFYFSGGGDPLLCKDLFKIIKHANESFNNMKVHIRTNGLLIGQYAEELTRQNIFQLEISVHGASSEVNNAILQCSGGHDVFRNIEQLNKYLRQYKSKMRKLFYVVVSRRNIHEVPEIIKRAHELKVKHVIITFARYYPPDYLNLNHNARMCKAESLFFDKQKYNDIILKSKRLAKSLGVLLAHEPLFFSKIKQNLCFQPWQIVLVDWDGYVYPCTGGETWFRQKIRSGIYDFGNLLKEDMSYFWNNDFYAKIRRTCNTRLKEDFIPECRTCHNTLCFKGADVENGHILKPANCEI